MALLGVRGLMDIYISLTYMWEYCSKIAFFKATGIKKAEDS
jgi:hypothetical protein